MMVRKKITGPRIAPRLSDHKNFSSMGVSLPTWIVTSNYGKWAVIIIIVKLGSDGGLLVGQCLTKLMSEMAFVKKKLIANRINQDCMHHDQSL